MRMGGWVEWSHQEIQTAASASTPATGLSTEPCPRQTHTHSHFYRCKLYFQSPLSPNSHCLETSDSQTSLWRSNSKQTHLSHGLWLGEIYPSITSLLMKQQLQWRAWRRAHDLSAVILQSSVFSSVAEPKTVIWHFRGVRSHFGRKVTAMVAIKSQEGLHSCFRAQNPKYLQRTPFGSFWHRDNPHTAIHLSLFFFFSLTEKIVPYSIL